MRIRKYALLLIMLVVSILPGQAANATTIGVGLDWRELIFVQEYWFNQRPFYAITNLRNQPVTIGVYGHNSNRQLAGPWTVAAQAVNYVNAGKLLGQNLIRFKLTDGTLLGLLEAPKPGATTDRRNITTYGGLNGSGGRSTTPWFEQTTLTFTSGKSIELRLLTQAQAGIINFSQTSLYPYEIPELLLVTADCATLPVEVKGTMIVIYTNKPLQEQPLHTIVLRFQAPVVQAPIMYTITGWLALEGDGGRGLTRGLIVRPEVGHE